MNRFLSGVCLAAAVALATPVVGKDLSSQEAWLDATRHVLGRHLVRPTGDWKPGTLDPVLHLVILKSGKIESAVIRRSSGEAKVDAAVLAMVKNSVKLPPFARDMKGDKAEMDVNVQLGVQDEAAARAESAARTYVHAPTGFRLRVPTPLQIVNPRSDPKHDILVDILSTTNVPPRAGTSKQLCAVGFKAGAVATTAAEINDAAAIDVRIAAMKAIQWISSGTVERAIIFERGGLKGLEFVIAPVSGPDHASSREYLALIDKPEGRVSVVCATTRDAWPRAMILFQIIRDHADVIRP